VQVTRREAADPELRIASQTQSVVDGLLTGTLKIPDAVGSIDINADLRVRAASPSRLRLTPGATLLISDRSDVPQDAQYHRLMDA
jgi:hypothetical protein